MISYFIPFKSYLKATLKYKIAILEQKFNTFLWFLLKKQMILKKFNKLKSINLMYIYNNNKNI